MSLRPPVRSGGGASALARLTPARPTPAAPSPTAAPDRVGERPEDLTAIWAQESSQDAAARATVPAAAVEGEFRVVPASILRRSPYQPLARPAPEAIAAVTALRDRVGGIAALAELEPTDYRRDDGSELPEVVLELLALVVDVYRHGVQQRVLVRSTVAGLELLSGHRRTVGADLAGVPVPIEVLHGLSDRDAARLVGRGNAFRTDMSPWQWAVLIHQMHAMHPLTGIDEGAVLSDIRQVLGRSRSTIYNSLYWTTRLLAEWSGWVPEAVAASPTTVAAALDTLSVRQLNRLAKAPVTDGARARLAQALLHWDTVAPPSAAPPTPPAISRRTSRAGGVVLAIAIDVASSTDADALQSVLATLDAERNTVTSRLAALGVAPGTGPRRRGR